MLSTRLRNPKLASAFVAWTGSIRGPWGGFDNESSRVTRDSHIPRARTRARPQVHFPTHHDGTVERQPLPNHSRNRADRVVAKKHTFGEPERSNPDVPHAPLTQPMLSTEFRIRESYPILIAGIGPNGVRGSRGSQSAIYTNSP
jgi:hypothetical protein